MEKLIKQVEEHGTARRGRLDILKHYKGETTNPREAIRAKCYDCIGYFQDEGLDCENPSCPLYPYFQYSSTPRKTAIKGGVPPKRGVEHVQTKVGA